MLPVSLESLHPNFRHSRRPVVDCDIPRPATDLAVLYVLLLFFPTGIQRDLHFLAAIGTRHQGGAVGRAVPQREVLFRQRVVGTISEIDHYFFVYTSEPKGTSPFAPA